MVQERTWCFMLFDLEAAQGERFQFFGSHLDSNTGETIYETPSGDAWVQVRSLTPFWEDRLAKRKKVVEHVYNPKTRSMERITYYDDLTSSELKSERDDAFDYAITDLGNFKDAKTGEEIACTRENKIKLMKVPVFDRFVARCQQLLAASGVKDKEDAEKN